MTRAPKRKPRTFKVWAWVGTGNLLTANDQVVVYRKIPTPLLRPAFVRATLTLTGKGKGK